MTLFEVQQARSPPDFCTFGMFIIDEIEYTGDHAPAKSIMGGAGTYAALGARLVAGREHAGQVSWIVDAGSDFPPHFRTQLQNWETGCVLRTDNSRLTTRAWNGYGENEYRAFKYLTPKLRLDETSLSTEQISSRSFHMACSPQRCISLTQGVIDPRMSRASAKSRFDRPIIVWEPVSDLCIPSELEMFRKASRYVDVVSPNADELASFFGLETPGGTQESWAGRILSWGIGPSGDGFLVVREGANGCTIYSHSWNCHLPAYFQSQESNRVIDPTGGGNTFLGALAIALVEGDDNHGKEFDILTSVMAKSTAGTGAGGRIFRASILATIAASYAIEQVGMPELQASQSAETWNGESFPHRLAVYLGREKHNLRIDQRTGQDTVQSARFS